MLSFAAEAARETVHMLRLASPFLLLGLAIAGLVHVLVPQRWIVRWMGRRGYGGVLAAAAIGVPLPVCSCGVVPISVELSRKGARRPAVLSFLTTTPESSVDSILLTWGLMGPVMALARPLAAFATALVGGGMALAFLQDEDARPAPVRTAEPAGEEGDACAAESCGTEACSSTLPEADETAEAHAALARVLRPGRGGLGAAVGGLWRSLFRPALAYGFVELLDDLAFWLVIGVGAAGVLTALLPADLAALGLGEGVVPLVAALVVGIPLYLCASASTPLAAALLAKGLSPGAALVFLLAGPATNAATVVLLAGTFGRRFVQIYLAAVVVGALGAGYLLDLLVGAQVVAAVAEADHAGGVLEWLAFGLTVALLAWRFARGAGRSGWRELRRGLVPTR